LRGWGPKRRPTLPQSTLVVAGLALVFVFGRFEEAPSPARVRRLPTRAAAEADSSGGAGPGAGELAQSVKRRRALPAEDVGWRRCVADRLRRHADEPGEWFPEVDAGPQGCDAFKHARYEHPRVKRLANLYNGSLGCDKGADDVEACSRGSPASDYAEHVRTRYTTVLQCKEPGYQHGVYRGGLLDKSPFKAKPFMQAVAGMHVVFLGDSVFRQLHHSAVCILGQQGYDPETVRFSTKVECEAEYANGVKLSKWTMTEIKKWQLKYLTSQLAPADLAFVSVGHHYSFDDRANYTLAVEALAAILADSPIPTILVEVSPVHFPTETGDLYDYNRKKTFWDRGMDAENKASVYPCHDVDFAAAGEEANWRNAALHKAAEKYSLPVLRIHDVWKTRWDAHQGWHSMEDGLRIRRPDCLHFCFNHELFEPLMARVLDTVKQSKRCASDLRKQSNNAAN